MGESRVRQGGAVLGQLNHSEELADADWVRFEPEEDTSLQLWRDRLLDCQRHPSRRGDFNGRRDEKKDIGWRCYPSQ